ncbi:hypothetical protein K8T06_01470 [bacterium]|nr:hypothetical protein [bacterium]
MKKLMLFIILCVSTAFATNIDPRDVLDEAQELAKDGKYEEALQKHIWFHNHALEYDKALYGVRLSYALSYWVELGKKYPKAKEELIKIRDTITQPLIDGNGNKGLFNELDAINDSIDDNENTLRLFKHLDKNYPAQAKSFWSIAERTVSKLEETELIKKYSREAEDKLAQFLAKAKPVDISCALLDE